MHYTHGYVMSYAIMMCVIYATGHGRRSDVITLRVTYMQQCDINVTCDKVTRDDVSQEARPVTRRLFSVACDNLPPPLPLDGFGVRFQ